MSGSGRRVALIGDGTHYVGPALARELVRRGHDLVVGSAAPGLVDELEATGATVAVAGRVHDDPAGEAAAAALVSTALERFGGFDAATAFGGDIIGGPILSSSAPDLRALVTGCLEAPYHFLRAVATMLARNLAAEVAPSGVQVNAVGTNFMDFPAFHAAAGTDDPAVRAALEARVPLRRMGTTEEFASFAMAFLDGSSGFTTGQFVAYAGGWV